jgi:MerR family transcriptional regulator/heat shock protein HspR
MTQAKRVTPKTAKRVTDGRDRALYVISIAAELAGVHPQTLRMYERKGLLQPKRTEGRVRRYSDRDIDHVRLIQSLTRDAGMNLAGVEMVMRMQHEMEELQDRMQRLQSEADHLRASLIDRARQTALVPLRNVERKS